MFKRLFSLLGLSPKEEVKEETKFEKAIEQIEVKPVIVPDEHRHSCGHINDSWSIRKDGSTICRECRQKELNA